MVQELSRDMVVKWSADQIAAPVGNDVVIMSVERGQYYNLRDVAGDIWQRLERPIKVDDLCRLLVERYDAPEDVLVSQLLSFLEELKKEKLLTVV